MNPIRNFAPEAAAVTVAELHRRLLEYLKQRFPAKIRRGRQESKDCILIRIANMK